MPRGDRTGPVGMGPMTGRGLGYCAGSRVPDLAFYKGRYCLGGRGWRNRRFFRGFYDPVLASPEVFYPVQEPVYNKQAEIDSLKAQKEFLRQDLEEIEKQISYLEEQDKEE